LVYNIVYKKSVHHDLRKLSKVECRRILSAIEGGLSQNAENCPQLKGPFKGLRKYRIGDYRIIFAITGNDVIILRIAHRREIYKKKI
jgi:mRNA interferase RelE/StbE